MGYVECPKCGGGVHSDQDGYDECVNNCGWSEYASTHSLPEKPPDCKGTGEAGSESEKEIKRVAKQRLTKTQYEEAIRSQSEWIGWDFSSSENKQQLIDIINSLTAERDELKSEKDYLLNVIEDKRRLTKEISDFLHPNSDGPKQPALCDVVKYVKEDFGKLKTKIDGWEGAILEPLQERYKFVCDENEKLHNKIDKLQKEVERLKKCESDLRKIHEEYMTAVKEAGKGFQYLNGTLFLVNNKP